MLALRATVILRRFLLLFWLVALVIPVTASGQEPVDALVERPRSNRAALFDDELDLLERTVLGWLEAQELAVRILPASTRDTLEAPQCAAPMSHHDVIRERLGRVARVSITAGCYGDPPCRLSVRVTRPPIGAGAWERIHEWRAEVPSGAGQVARFLAAVPNLVEPPPPDGVGVGLLMGGRAQEREPVRIDWVAPAGRWRHAPGPDTIAEAIQSELNACHEAGWSGGPQEHAVLAFARDGSVSRCEAILRREPIDRARAACLCRALSNARVPAGPSDRRIELGVMNSTASGVLAGEVTHYTRFEMRSAENGFRAYPGFDRVREPAARCFAMTGITDVTRIGLRIFADAHGAMTRAEIDGTNLSPELARCLQGVLRPLAFTCPTSGETASWSGDLVGYTQPR
jgi:hypothetical protein